VPRGVPSESVSAVVHSAAPRTQAPLTGRPDLCMAGAPRGHPMAHGNRRHSKSSAATDIPAQFACPLSMCYKQTMTQTTYQLEAPFAGDSRHRLVEGLVTIFKQTAETGTPIWVSLEAPSGWGKSRVVHEFYRRLAAKHQEEPKYWPDSILAGVPEEELATAGGRRKRVAPQAWRRPANAIASWFWWGIACRSDRGAPIQGLIADLREFETHKVGLETAWRHHATIFERVTDKARQLGSEASRTLANELANDIFPMSSLITWLGTIAYEEAVDALESRRSQRHPQLVDSKSPNTDLVATTADELRRTFARGLPLVIYVDDIHHASHELAMLLHELLDGSGAIMVVTTALPGKLEETGGRAEDLILSRHDDRRVRVIHDRPSPERLPKGAGLAELETGALAEIVLAKYPHTAPPVVTMLTERHRNPLALEMVLELPRVFRKSTDGRLDVTAADLQRIPTSLEDLYRQSWQELPDGVQSTLILSALQSPASVSPEHGYSDDRWDNDLLTEVLATEPLARLLPDGLPLRTPDVGAPANYAWARPAYPPLFRFNEPYQRSVALEFGQDYYDDDATREIYSEITRLLDVAEGPPSEVQLHRARLMWALYRGGFIPTDQLCSLTESLTRACRIVVAETKATPGDLPHKIAVATGATGLYSKTLGKSHRDTLRSRRDLAYWLDQAGKNVEATDRLRKLLDDTTTALGSDDPLTLTVRKDLAHSLSQQDETEEALVLYRDLLVDQRRIRGEEHIETLAIRNDIALCLAGIGRVDEAVEQLRALVDAQRQTLGSEHPDTLGTRHSLAYWLGTKGDIGQAIEQLRSLLDDSSRIYGPDYADNLATRNNLAFALGQVGKTDEATDLFRELLTDTERILGPDHPKTLLVRDNLASSLAAQGQSAKAIHEYRALLRDRDRVLGPNHPDTVTALNHLAHHLAEAGQMKEAIELYATLLEKEIRLRGPDDPETLATRNDLGLSLEQAGRLKEAIVQFEALSDGQVRTLGRDHPTTLHTRNRLACVLGAIGRSREAVDQLKELVEDATRILGADDSTTLLFRSNLAASLARSDRYDEAIREYRELLKDHSRKYGPDHAATRSFAAKLESALTRARPRTHEREDDGPGLDL